MADESTTIEPGTVLAGRYRVEHRLGEGGMGSVFLVQHMHTDQKLALKVLHSTVVKDATALDRFRREARAPARIQSDHVVQVTDADVAQELGGVPFLVMEWLRGEDLEQLSSRGALPFPEVVFYMRQAARALDKAHGMGIVHRDLKPENVFLTRREDGTPWIKLLDFGIAKLTGASGDLGVVGSATSTGQIFGTPLYMSPEQAKAETDKISPQSDIWALGLIAHKLLTGKDFWTATTLTHLVAQIAYEPIPPPSALGVKFGPAYDAWFLRCCARDPKERYASAGEAVTALAEALGVNEATSGFGEARVSRISVSTGMKREKRDETIAFAATAHDSGVLAESAAGAAKVSSPGAAPQASSERPQRLRKIAGVAAVAVAVGGLGIWLALSRPQAQVDPGAAAQPAAGGQEPAAGVQGQPAPTSGAMERPVVVTPSASPIDPSAAPTHVATAPPQPEPTSPPPASSSKPLSTRPTAGTTKPPVAPPPTTTPATPPTTTPTTPPPAKTVKDPLDSRY